jgi:hypothetical protein
MYIMYVCNMKVDGVGISKETCIIWGGVEKGGVFKIKAASPSSIVYVNGRKLKYSSTSSLSSPDEIVESSNMASSEHASVVILKHNDRIALGHCAYILLVVDPLADKKKRKEAAEKDAGGGSDNNNESTDVIRFEKEITYDTSVHEVMLMRAHGENEYKERLAAFVINKLRLPAVRVTNTFFFFVWTFDLNFLHRRFFSLSIFSCHTHAHFSNVFSAFSISIASTDTSCI